MGINILCCLHGSWPDNSKASKWKRGGGVEYVKRLKRAVERNLSLPHSFFCLTDKPIEGVNCKPILPAGGAKVLLKLSCYNPAYEFKGFCLIFDLDNVIIRNFDEMVNVKSDWVVRARRFRPKMKVPDGDMQAYRAGSKKHLDFWRYCNETDAVWQQEHAEHKPRERALIQDAPVAPDMWQELLGNNYVISYKQKCRHDKPPPGNTRVVSFHGKPKPHELKNEWIRKNWY